MDIAFAKFAGLAGAQEVATGVIFGNSFVAFVTEAAVIPGVADAFFVELVVSAGFAESSTECPYRWDFNGGILVFVCASAPVQVGSCMNAFWAHEFVTRES